MFCLFFFFSFSLFFTTANIVFVSTFIYHGEQMWRKTWQKLRELEPRRPMAHWRSSRRFISNHELRCNVSSQSFCRWYFSRYCWSLVEPMVSILESISSYFGRKKSSKHAKNSSHAQIFRFQAKNALSHRHKSKFSVVSKPPLSTYIYYYFYCLYVNFSIQLP